MKAGERKGKAFILRVRQVRESDALVIFLDSTGEKITAFARAGLKSKKRFGGCLEPLLHVDYQANLKVGSDMIYLNELQIRTDFAGIRQNFETIGAASYLAEITELGIHEGLSNVGIYNLFGNSLRAMDTTSAAAPAVAVVEAFELKFLALMGWFPSLQTCGQCGNDLFCGGAEASVDPHQGYFVCQDCGPYAVGLSLMARERLHQILEAPLNEGLRRDNEVCASFISRQLLQVHLDLTRLGSIKFRPSL